LFNAAAFKQFNAIGGHQGLLLMVECPSCKAVSAGSGGVESSATGRAQAGQMQALPACVCGQPLQRVPGNRGLHAPAALRRQAGADGALVGLAAQRAAAGVYEGIGGHGRSVEAITHREWRGQENALDVLTWSAFSIAACALNQWIQVKIPSNPLTSSESHSLFRSGLAQPSSAGLDLQAPGVQQGSV
jgi:hypothetical protein